MQVIVALLSGLAFLAIWYFRIKMFGRMARGRQDAGSSPADLQQQLADKRRTGQRSLSSIKDPREAAALMMMEIAKARGTFTDKQETCIRQEIEHHFQFESEDANRLIDHARWLSDGIDKPHAAMSRMTDVIQHASDLGPKEMVDLDGMLVTVSEAEGSPTAAQLNLLAMFRQKAGLRV